jgi:hypothetical protein
MISFLNEAAGKLGMTINELFIATPFSVDTMAPHVHAAWIYTDQAVRTVTNKKVTLEMHLDGERPEMRQYVMNLFVACARSSIVVRSKRTDDQPRNGEISRATRALLNHAKLL